MNLREALSPEHGEPVPDDSTPKERWEHFSAFAYGWGTARGVRLTTSTDGSSMRIHNLDADTRSAKVVRDRIETVGAAYVAALAQLDALPYWEPESDDWGPDPWADGRDVRREDA